MVINGRRNKIIVLDHKLTYFGKLDTKDKSCYTENEDTSIFQFHICRVRRSIYQQIIDIPIKNKMCFIFLQIRSCTPLR
jgi:hypothetical protein